MFDLESIIMVSLEYLISFRATPYHMSNSNESVKNHESKPCLGLYAQLNSAQLSLNPQTSWAL